MNIQRRFRNYLNEAVEFVRQHKRQMIVLALILIVSGILFLVFYLNRNQIISAADWLKKDYLPSHTWQSRLIIVGMLIATSFPPLIGYGLTLTLSGWLFGVWGGFAINFVGALLGASLCFAVTRFVFKRRGHRSSIIGTSALQQQSLHLNPSQQAHYDSTQDPSLASSLLQVNHDYDHNDGSHDQLLDSSMMPRFIDANAEYVPLTPRHQQSHRDSDNASSVQSIIDIIRAPQKKSENLLSSLSRYLSKNPHECLKMIILLRLAPYPYTLLNITLPNIDSVPMHKFVIGTAVSLVKTILHAMVGSQLDDFAEAIRHGGVPSGGGNGNKVVKILEWTGLGIASLFAVVGGYYIFFMIQKALRQVQQDDHDEAMGSALSVSLEQQANNALVQPV
ncbi:hypothetical protein MIR68_007150 [Amoeboaphelidium protococcarum]|nr:hypothetical protein MIR68_007150 [Amoeboaphelidium protococcarum]